MINTAVKTALSSILRNAILSLRFQAEKKVDYKQIYALADMIHNLPSMLENWDDLSIEDPKILEFYIKSFQEWVIEYEAKYPEDVMKYSKLFNIQ
jgi:hypothetical protein